GATDGSSNSLYVSALNGAGSSDALALVAAGNIQLTGSFGTASSTRNISWATTGSVNSTVAQNFNVKSIVSAAFGGFNTSGQSFTAYPSGPMVIGGGINTSGAAGAASGTAQVAGGNGFAGAAVTLSSLSSILVGSINTAGGGGGTGGTNANG